MKNNIEKCIGSGKGLIQKIVGDWRLATSKKASNYRLLTFAVFLLSTVLFSSCEDVIDVKLKENDLNLIAVEASITTRDEPTVYLYNALKVN